MIKKKVPIWIIIGLDAPFWFDLPFYFETRMTSRKTSIVLFNDTVHYASTGGDSGKLFLAKPHEVVRYVRILKNKGLL